MLRTYLPCPKMFSGLNVRAKSEPRLPDSRSVLQSPCNDRSYKKDRTPGWLSHCYWGLSAIAPLAKSSRARGVVILPLPPNVTTPHPRRNSSYKGLPTWTCLYCWQNFLVWLCGRNATGALPVLQECPSDRNSQLVFLLSFSRHKRNGATCLVEKKKILLRDVCVPVSQSLEAVVKF